MKAKFFTGILTAGVLMVTAANAQMDDRSFRDNDTKVVINNYYDNYDYFYASRINRFHRSYSHFDYYAPVFTDTYWYSYQPFSWGVSIYGGGFGMGFGYSSPVYGYSAGWDPFWSDPYFSSSYYMGYDPFYYRPWYPSPVVNINIGYSWPRSYWGYNGHYHPDYHHHHYEYAIYHNNQNNYYSTRYTSSGNSYRRNSPSNLSNNYNYSNRRGMPNDNGSVNRSNTGDPRRGYIPSDRRGASNSGGNGIPNNTSNTVRRSAGGNNAATGSYGNNRNTGTNGNVYNNANRRSNSDNSNYNNNSNINNNRSGSVYSNPNAANRGTGVRTPSSVTGNTRQITTTPSGSAVRRRADVNEQTRHSSTIYNNQVQRNNSNSGVRMDRSQAPAGSSSSRSGVSVPRTKSSSSVSSGRSVNPDVKDKGDKRR